MSDLYINLLEMNINLCMDYEHIVKDLFRGTLMIKNVKKKGRVRHLPDSHL